MRILLANYRYFVSGGPERYLFQVRDAFFSRGHEIIPFSIHYSRNEQTPYSEYFVEPLGSRDEVLFQEQRRTLKGTWRTIERLFYSPEVERAVVRLVKDTQPEIAYVLAYLRKLSPSLLVGLKKADLPIVVRLSDYSMFCPKAICLRDNKPCQLCISGNLLHSIRYRCIQSSLIGSTLNAIATLYHRGRKYFDLIDQYVTPSRYLTSLMVQAGFPESKLTHVPTLVDTTRFRPDKGRVKGKSFAYIGRLEYNKGIHVLLDAVRILTAQWPDSDFVVKIAGKGNPDYRAILEQQIEQSRIENHVEFLGELDVPQIIDLLNDTMMSVIPSIWYENLPNALIESFACGTAVIATDTGSLSESIVNGNTGFLFRWNDSAHLAEIMNYCLLNSEQMLAMGQMARAVAEAIYSPQRHVSHIESVFQQVIDGNL